jgi:hypothetical protein
MSEYLKAGWSRTSTYQGRGVKRRLARTRISGVAIAWPRYPRGGYSAVLRWHRWYPIGRVTTTYPNSTKIGGLWVTWRRWSLGLLSVELTTRWFLRERGRTRTLVRRPAR